MAERNTMLAAAVAVVIIIVAAAALLMGGGGGATTSPAATSTTAAPAAGATTSPTKAATTPTATASPTQTATATETRTQTSTATPTQTGTQTGATASPTQTPSPATSPTATTTTAATATATAAPQCREEITLVVLTRHPADIQEMARRAFLKSDIARRFCIKDIRFISLPPGFWPQRIKSSNIDVAWGGGPTLFDELYMQHLLRPLETKLALEAAAQVPDEIAGMPMKRKGPDGKIYWVGAALASFGFTVNTEVAQQLGFDWHKLRTWKDLASDELGLILLNYGTPPVAIANPLQSTSNTRMYEIILQAYGWDEGWSVLTRMAANARIEEGSELVRDDVIAGEVLVGITIDFYGYTAERLTGGVCRYILPQGETIVNGDPIAVTVSTKHPEAAEAFVAWVLTEGQAIWLHPNINRLPANPKVFEMPLEKICSVTAQPCDVMKEQVALLSGKFQQALHAKAMKFNDTLALETEYPMQLYFVATLKDNHELLQEAWTRLLEAYYVKKTISREKFEELKKMLGEPVVYKDPVTGENHKFTMEDAIRVGKLLREAMAKGNAQLKDQYMNAWRDAARAKYKAILEELGG